MCLSTAYDVSGEERSLLCEYVSKIDVKSGMVYLTDLFGRRQAVPGVLESLDLVNNVILIEAQKEKEGA